MAQTFHLICSVLIGTVLGTAWLGSAIAEIHGEQGLAEKVAAFAHNSPTRTVAEGSFLIRRPHSSGGSYSLETQYDDTEQPQRNVCPHSFLPMPPSLRHWGQPTNQCGLAPE